MQGFNGKNLNLFIFLAGKTCYLHNCATVLSKGFPLGEVVEGTTNICLLFFEICKFFYILITFSGLRART